MRPVAGTAIAAIVLASAACSADEAVTSVQADRAGAAETGHEHDDSGYVIVEFDESVTIEQGVAWNELLPTLPTEIRDVFPDSDVFNPTWWFDTTTTVDHKTDTTSVDCTPRVASRPTGVLARFQVGRPLSPTLYREGVLEITVLHDDASVVAAYADARVESVECLADALSDDVSLERIDDVLPDHATIGYNLTWKSTDDPTEPSVGFTVIQLHHDDVFAQVMMNAIQPADHPDWIDVERDAIRVARALDLDT